MDEIVPNAGLILRSTENTVPDEQFANIVMKFCCESREPATKERSSSLTNDHEEAGCELWATERNAFSFQVSGVRGHGKKWLGESTGAEDERKCFHVYVADAPVPWQDIT